MIGTPLETVVEQEAEEPPEESLETEIEAEEPEKPLPALIRYSSLEDQLTEEISYSLPLDLYEVSDSEDEEPASSHQAYAVDTLEEEAKEQVQESKYEFLEPSDTNFEEKKKLGIWILFNPASYAFLESFHNLDRDTDYNTA